MGFQPTPWSKFPNVSLSIVYFERIHFEAKSSEENTNYTYITELKHQRRREFKQFEGKIDSTYSTGFFSRNILKKTKKNTMKLF